MPDINYHFYYSRQFVEDRYSLVRVKFEPATLRLHGKNPIPLLHRVPQSDATRSNSAMMSEDGVT